MWSFGHSECHRVNQKKKKSQIWIPLLLQFDANAKLKTVAVPMLCTGEKNVPRFELNIMPSFF